MSGNNNKAPWPIRKGIFRAQVGQSDYVSSRDSSPIIEMPTTPQATQPNPFSPRVIISEGCFSPQPQTPNIIRIPFEKSDEVRLEIFRGKLGGRRNTSNETDETF